MTDEEPTTPELPKLILSSSDCIMQRMIEDVSEGPLVESDRWELSDPIPGVRIINTWEIYHGINLVLTANENGHYGIFRSIDFVNFAMVHDHDSKIYGLFYIDEGHAIFSAEDGWWETENAGLDWMLFSNGGPKARSATIIAGNYQGDDIWYIIAYGEDHKLYYYKHPDGSWIESIDTATIWSSVNGKWYPALCGSPVGILAGAGNKLLRSDEVGQRDSWYIIQEVEGIIKSIIVSNLSNLPTFLIEVEQLADGEMSKLYWSYDLGDSLEPDLNRISLISSVQSVYPTGTNERQTMFVLLGKRTAESQQTYQVLEE